MRRLFARKAQVNEKVLTEKLFHVSFWKLPGDGHNKQEQLSIFEFF